METAPRTNGQSILWILRDQILITERPTLSFFLLGRWLLVIARRCSAVQQSVSALTQLPADIFQGSDQQFDTLSKSIGSFGEGPLTLVLLGLEYWTDRNRQLHLIAVGRKTIGSLRCYGFEARFWSLSRLASFNSSHRSIKGHAKFQRCNISWTISD